MQADYVTLVFFKLGSNGKCLATILTRMFTLDLVFLEPVVTRRKHLATSGAWVVFLARLEMPSAWLDIGKHFATPFTREGGGLDALAPKLVVLFVVQEGTFVGVGGNPRNERNPEKTMENEV